MIRVDVGEGLASWLKGDIVHNSDFRIKNCSRSSDAREGPEDLEEQIENMTARGADEGDP
jgi:hypothetical protein